MKKSFLFIAIISLIIVIIAKCFSPGSEPIKIGLIPLDSRPANTQYVELLGAMTNADITIPYDYLDNYLEPAKKEKLWDWLVKEGKNFDKIIINTTELFNGSLIASRHPASYQDTISDLKRLEDFCRKNTKKEITVITILPRLLPSQFSKLWGYQDDLIAYAQEIDKKALSGLEIPPPPKNIPLNIVEEYLSIYSNAEIITEKLIFLANQGLISRLLIGQDDAEEFGLSNKIVREIQPNINEKIQFVHGADELTMLTLAKILVPKPIDSFQISYSNEDFKKAFFPFEAAELESVIKTKMDYLNLPQNTNNSNLQIIHTDTKSITVYKSILKGATSNYLGIMDIAFTNKGDIRTLDYLLSPEILNKVQGYAGWNTASNTIGTELAHFVLYQNLKENFINLSKEAQEQALKAYIEFKFIRIAEDLVYQGILRERLNEELIKRNITPTNLGENKDEAEKILKELYEEYEKILVANFKGEQSIGELRFMVEDISSHIELPWGRTFEAKIVPKAILAWE